jgi:transposase-like protein
VEAERGEFLGRGRHEPLDDERANYRDGYRPREINFFGLGAIELRVPRDRQGEFASEWLPKRGLAQSPEFWTLRSRRDLYVGVV